MPRFPRAGPALALVLGVFPVSARSQEAGSAPEIRTPPGHPMHYLVALPTGWTAAKTWALLVVITDADREFAQTTRAFSAARGALPFVIVTPLVLGGGGTAQQHKSDFDYDSTAWARADKDGNCKFDEDGLTAVLADVKQRYHTEDRAYITGWEAGGHVILRQVLDHPERWRAAAVVTPNFQGRCLDAAPASHDADALALPVRILHGTADPAWDDGQPLYAQWLRFDSLARSRGFTDVKDVSVPGGSHGPLVESVFSYLSTLRLP